MERSLILRGVLLAATVAIALPLGVAGCGSTVAQPGTADLGGAGGGGESDHAGLGNKAGAGGIGVGGVGVGGRAAGGASGATGGHGPITGGAAGVGASSGVGGFVSSFGSTSPSGGRAGGGAGGVMVVGGAAGAMVVGGAAGAGGNGCLEGVPCNCDAQTVGVTACTNDKPSCTCPPADMCQATPGTPCFTPCGGEPFGAWVLDDSCVSGTSTNGTCQKVLTGTPSTGSPLRIRILDGGELDVSGDESWNLDIKASLGCFGISSVDSCGSQAVYWDSLIFAYSGSAYCASNACGVCDCASTYDAGVTSMNSWSRASTATRLQLGASAVDYCIQGDELWVGGTADDGTPKVSYKFKKESCTGTPVACAARTPAQCAVGQSCQPGLCSGAARCTNAYSQAACGVLQGCTWDPNGCSGQAPTTCDFYSCDTEPGCSWGPPQEQCGGYAYDCSSRSQDTCAGSGCSAVVCNANFSDSVDCSQLKNATDCAKAPGCVAGSGTTPCTGQTSCVAQTDTGVCSKLNCLAYPGCIGVTTQCTGLSPTDCYNVPGCQNLW